MIAFLGYSIADSEQYVLTLIAQKLQEQGFSLTSDYSNYYEFDAQLSFQTQNAIKNAGLFIGVVTRSGNTFLTQKVYKEMDFAIQNNKPTIFLLEDQVQTFPWVTNYPNTIRFNRAYPQQAIEEVNRKIQISKNGIQKDNTLAWILGGAAALALIGLLSSEKR